MQEKEFGLIGFPLKNTFSKNYFESKFFANKLPYSYQNFEIKSIDELKEIFQNHKNLKGLNVTRPYKTLVIPFLDKLDESAKLCGAVNCIQISNNGKKTGFNTDFYGFKKSLENFIGSNRNLKALVLGDGGAAKAVIAVLNAIGITYSQVTRKTNKIENSWNYDALTKEIIRAHKLLIQTTPVGMFPNENESLIIPFEGLSDKHFCFDLIYLPEKTKFLLESEKRGAVIKNGLEMLHLQADEAYRIWLNEET
ncbi:MAG: shikimate dehydrogenase [Bacteroidia bacterium]|nr:shikimate dehydrogenase [Bacteroidia bacterium]MCF8427638.1 shikimate dehydrogenase [Bacteroidia bacterium]MCF8446997.1 shikimate dehydrogenase [Bacteroidia bacterium]